MKKREHELGGLDLFVVAKCSSLPRLQMTSRANDDHVCVQRVRFVPRRKMFVASETTSVFSDLYGRFAQVFFLQTGGENVKIF